jgi:hypothetical protein
MIKIGEDEPLNVTKGESVDVAERSSEGRVFVLLWDRA